MLENKLAHRLSLSGQWQISLNGKTGDVVVPGVWEIQGFSADDAGPALYRRSFTAPAEWDGAKIVLSFEAVSYYVDVYVNGQHVGAHEGLWTPFEFDITAFAHIGQTNDIELHITKPGRDGDAYPYREVLVGFIPYIATTFGGPWGDVYLTAHSAPTWKDIHIAQDWRTGEVQVQAAVNGQHEGLTASAEICNPQGQVVARGERTLQPGENNLSLSLAVDHPANWSPEMPNLYELRLCLSRQGEIITETSRRCGFRQLCADGERLLLNGQPAHLRGVLSWGWNPATLAPVFSDDEIRAEFRRVRELGFNLVKLCLFVPQPRLLDIADEEGMLLWLELPMWLPRLSDHLRRQAVAEYSDILANVHHHPSLVLYSLGCELGKDMADAALLGELDTIVRGGTAGVLVCDNSGSGEAYKGLSFDFADFSDYHFYSDLHYFNPLVDHFHRDWRPPRPWIFGEFCDKDDYRDTSAVQENGQRPWWRDVLGVEGDLTRWSYQAQEQLMEANHLPFTERQLVHISRQESFLIRKVILEQTRLRRYIGGYVVTGLRDTPISTSGVFDDLNRPKYDPARFRQFNGDTVLLLERGRARVWHNGGDRPAPVDLWNYGSGDTVDLRVVLAQTERLSGEAELTWTLRPLDSSTPFLSNSLSVRIPAESPPQEIARLSFTVPIVEQARQWELHLQLDEYSNQWPLYFYPSIPDWPQNLMRLDPTGLLADIPARPFETGQDGVLVSTVFTSEVKQFVMNGGKAVVLQTRDGGLPTVAVPFWREAIKLLYPHPLLSRFPHQGYAGLQFYHLATDYSFDTRQLESLPEISVVTPIIRRLDARLFTLSDYLVELKLGTGTLLASTLAFGGSTGDQVNSLKTNIAGRHLLSLMVQYLK